MVDALTPAATFLTVTVFDDEMFDELFGDAVSVNAEGALVTTAESAPGSRGVPFTGDTVGRIVTNEPLTPSTACLLDRAWSFREAILTEWRVVARSAA